ncbi:hypothetical protein T10_2815 [Trichinella papuae]|uniref:Uncharacterized protein n=1 Tax=Trichinella papuae TaxID=268474 RepID=A0A0V1M5G6_9BILA|nr:hypothetical protein T10_2815 [Trichinella papuae]
MLRTPLHSVTYSVSTGGDKIRLALESVVVTCDGPPVFAKVATVCFAASSDPVEGARGKGCGPQITQPRRVSISPPQMIVDPSMRKK